MSSIPRGIGESVTDWTRRIVAGAGLDPDLAVGPATNGPRFADESTTAWKERLAARDRFFARLQSVDPPEDT
jgi:hypothetical protein